MQSRRYDDAIAQFRKILRTESDLPVAHEGLWVAFHQKRMYEEALAEAKKYFEVQGDREVVGALGRGYAEAGYPGAMSLAAEKLAERSKQTYVQPRKLRDCMIMPERKTEPLSGWRKPTRSVSPPWSI